MSVIRSEVWEAGSKSAVLEAGGKRMALIHANDQQGACDDTWKFTWNIRCGLDITSIFMASGVMKGG
jgi:hypothetical protein